jgi:pimeloyl-ACP methyl ester carboxylesterase
MPTPSRPILLLLPGLMCDAGIWRDQATALGGDYDVRIPDFFGLESLQDMARAALALADGPVAVAGHSMGGRVAMEAFALAPERIERIALLDTGAHPVAPGERERRQALLDIADREGIEGVIAAWLPPMLAPDRITDRPLVEAVSAMIRRAGLGVLRGQVKALLDRPDGFARLNHIRCPTALIVGRQDAWSPPAQHEQMQAHCPQATLTIIEDCGHMAPVERPQAVGEALQKWMQA